jgi:hypothetical protein
VALWTERRSAGTTQFLISHDWECSMRITVPDGGVIRASERVVES